MLFSADQTCDIAVVTNDDKTGHKAGTDHLGPKVRIVGQVTV